MCFGAVKDFITLFNTDVKWVYIIIFIVHYSNNLNNNNNK